METEKTESGTEQAAVVEDKVVRSHPLFVKELDKAHKKAKELEARLAELEAAQVERAKLLETKKLEDAGKYNEVLQQREAELAAKTKEIKLLQEQAARNLISVEAKAELRTTGIINDPEIIELYARKYAVDNSDNAKLPEYIAALKAEKPYLFTTAAGPVPTTKGKPAPSVQAAATSGLTVAQLKADLRDKTKAKAASAKLTEMLVRGEYEPAG